jgi:hypothetical protein
VGLVRQLVEAEISALGKEARDFRPRRFFLEALEQGNQWALLFLGLLGFRLLNNLEILRFGE